LKASLLQGQLIPLSIMAKIQSKTDGNKTVGSLGV